MRIALVTAGTRGDVQPMVALGVELSRRGHDVVLGHRPTSVTSHEEQVLTRSRSVRTLASSSSPRPAESGSHRGT